MLEADGRSSEVLVLRLSSAGCLFECSTTLVRGDNVRITFHDPDAKRVEAEIMWSTEGLVGCNFAKMLSDTGVKQVRLSDPVSSGGQTVADIDLQQLAQAIRKARWNAQMSASEMAKRAGLTRPTLWS